MQDVLYAFRLIRRTPGLAATAIVSLALGIGVNALVFSVINGLVLRPLPGVADPGRVVFLQDGNGAGESFPNYVDLRNRSTAFDSLAGYRIAPMSVETGATASAQPRRAWGYLATGSYFDTLGVKPAAGRFFHAEEDRNPGEPALAVLSYDEWTAHYGGSSDVIGSTIRINAHPFTVIGVAPSGFIGSEIFYRPAIWVPMMMEPVIEPGHNWLDARATFNMWVIGRLSAGVTVPQAEANLAPITADLARTYPWPNKNMVIHLARPGLVGNLLRTPVRAFGVAVLLLAALVLVAACANLAGLLLARGADRQREMAIRLSIGAGRARLVRQLLTESLVLALAGGAIGAATAAILARALSAWQIPVTLPMQLDVSVDWRVVMFACAISTAAGLLFGVAPARFASATDPNLALKGGVQGRAGRRWSFRDALIAVQVALCFVLVTACLLSARGLQRALEAPLGFTPRGVAIASFDLGLAGYDKARGLDFQRRVAAEAARIPGAISAGIGNTLPLSMDQSHSAVYRPGALKGDPAPASAVVYSVSPGYLGTVGIPLRSGRDFDARDTPTSTPVAIVNETFVRQVLGTDAPIGAHFTYGPGGRLVEVIGVTGDATFETIGEAPRAAAFNPEPQWYNPTTVLAVRSSLPEAETAAAVRQVITRLDPSLPLYDVEGAEAMMWWAFLPSRAAAIALGVFGLLAISLAATGLHGLVAYAVSRRSREIAIRVAIGANARDVLRLVLTRTASLIAIGAVAGIALAIAATRLLSSVLFGVPPNDAGMLAAVALAMAFVGIAACWAPSRRALRLQPATLLKAE